MFFDGLNLTTKRSRAKLDPAAFNVYVPPPEKPVKHFTLEELLSSVGSTFVFDVECYPNYFCVVFKCIATGMVVVLERSPEADFNGEYLQWIMNSFVLVGFNSKNYDIPILALAAAGASCAELKAATDYIIVAGARPREFYGHYNLEQPKPNHIDLIEVAPLPGTSLKTYSGRLHCQRMQDLPFKPDTHLTKEEARVVMLYCVNDLDNTTALCRELREQLDLRHAIGQQYGIDLRSLSDAQLAEAVIMKELRRLTNGPINKPDIDFNETIKYKVPNWVAFKTPVLQKLLARITEAEFCLDAGGSPRMPDDMKGLQVQLGRGTYAVGIGGLHSTEKGISYVSDNKTLIVDNDVASYYPNIILNQSLYPKHLGKAFLRVYSGIVARRLAAKDAGNKVEADSLKITINGSFGKLGSMYSMLYAPDLMLQVTITGQLGLLMQIEMLELAGIPVISANTDGVVTLCPQERYNDLRAIITEWERITGFKTEETRYRSLWSRDVNNYIAVKTDGKTKSKGVYSEKGSALNSVLSKNPEHLICSDAVQAFLSNGTPVDETIRNCRDLRRFVSVRNVKGGAVKDNSYLGKVVRWYYATGADGVISYAMTGNKVSKSDMGKPCMDLPEEFPTDIDYQWYIDTAWEMLREVGYYNQNGSGQFF